MTARQPERPNGKIMTCAEFQEMLPDLFESGKNPSEEEHVKTCANCAALVRDLEYIASQAKLLLPIHDPAPAVWDNIQSALRREPDNGRP
ncbi:hypothetical protein [Acidipila rosea]|uniref:Uncharacterized protein n=1 Tax=Acidipila rosea TaxID=768535 RepID=A0A4R1LCR0_9BACT|nr:hypothetical protein [Acidipila rosea]TCK75427.1 hypothetical protein C7378_0410 [Acidipila rosea]